MSGEIARRALLVGGALCLSSPVLALGRTTLGGKVSLRIPWPVSSIDPHRLDDAMAAFFTEALFDGLYARDETGIVAALAEGDPEPDGASLRVKLRAGLLTGRGAAIEPRDVAASLARSRAAGGYGWLADIPPPRIDGRSLVFATKDSSRLVKALASPIAAIVPATFSSDAPDGTGAFRIGLPGGAVVLSRNPHAARGPAFLDEITVHAAPNREASLRSFEAHTDDVGWHGLGIGGERRDAKAFDMGAVGFVVLSTGHDAKEWDAPGVAQRMCDAVLPSRVREFNLGPDWTADASQGWGGPTTTLVVRDDSPWLLDLANAVATLISRPGHEITVKAVNDFAARRTSRKYGLSLNIVRVLAPGSLAAMMALTTADSRTRAAELASHMPKLGEVNARTLTRTMRTGVLGELRVQGGRVLDLVLPPSLSAPGGWDLSNARRVRPR